MRNSTFSPLLVALVSIVVVCISAPWTSAGPLAEWRVRREIYPEIAADSENDEESEWRAALEVCVVGEVSYAVNESVPAEQACLNCKCQPPGVHCETIRCAKKPGCRAIHRPNTCCPDYQCECTHDGRTYANGERLSQPPGSECRVCYCRGGEVQCADVSCYTRSDCEGRIVPGKCCRKYDHCPPKDPSNVLRGNEILDGNHTKTETVQFPMITIHEIIPEVKEIPITNSPRRKSEGEGVQSSMEGGIMSDSENSVETLSPEEDVESESSEITEVYQQPPPILRVGDKLLYVQKDGQVVSEHARRDTPDTVITIVGAEGLQRGFEEAGERGNAEHVEETTYIVSLLKTPPENGTDFLFTDVDDLLPGQNSSEILDIAEDYNFTSSQAPPLSSVYSWSPVSTLPSNTIESETISSAPTMNVSSEKEEIETNPEYPPIPDVMTQPLEEIDVVPQSDKHHVELHPSEVPSSTQQSETSAASFHSRSIESMESSETVDPIVESSEHFTERDDMDGTPSYSLELVEIMPEFVVSSSTNPPSDVESAKNFTHQEGKSKHKRNSDEDASIFHELDREIGLESGTLQEDEGSPEEQAQEARRIFEELLQEANSNTTPKPISLVGSTPKTEAQIAQAQALGKIGDALSKFRLRDAKNVFDGNLLSIVRDLFTAQYRAYN